VPLYRQRAILLHDFGIDVALSMINDAVLRVGELLIPIVAVTAHELLPRNYIQADEPMSECRRRARRARTIRHISGSTAHRAKVFDFEMTHSKVVPKAFFKDYGGILHTDGYAA
jgi:hypothetical protein